MNEADRQDLAVMYPEEVKHLFLKGVPCAVLDFETTDIENPRPVQVAVVHVDLGDSPTLAYQTLVNPEAPISEEASRVHGLTQESVADAPTWAEVCPAVRGALRGRVLAAYNLPFEARVLSEVGVSLPFFGFDPLVWAKHVDKYKRGKKLVDVCRRRGLDIDAHDAAGDAMATARLMHGLLRDLWYDVGGGFSTVGELWEVQVRMALEQERDYAAYRARQGQEPPRMEWHRLCGRD